MEGPSLPSPRISLQQPDSVHLQDNVRGSGNCTFFHLCSVLHFFVMPIYDSVHIRHRALAYLHIISVEKFVEFLAFRKVLVDEL